MGKIHIMNGKRWKYILVDDTLFEKLLEEDIIRSTNSVFCIRPYDKLHRPISLNIPYGRPISYQDFTYVDENGDSKPVILC
jgi:hypothetical protein